MGLIVNASGRYQELIRGIVVTVDGEPAAAQYGQSGGPTVTGNTYSVTNSVLSMLVGIAIGEGSIAGVDQTLGQMLPTYLPVMAPGVADLTLKQLLTKTGGILGDDSNADTGPTTEDWVSDILATPLEHLPGTFGYSSRSSHLLSAILTSATGRPVLDYAREKLFVPLGISSEPAATPVDPDATYDTVPGFGWRSIRAATLGYSSLKITPVEMAALGQLYLDGGQWQGEQVVPEAWVRESTQPLRQCRVRRPEYGYQWWIDTVDGHPPFSARCATASSSRSSPTWAWSRCVSANNGPASFYTTDLLDILAEQVIPVVAG